MPQKPNDPRSAEPARYDDAVIGRAFRWSFLAVILIGLLAAALFWFVRRPPASRPAKVTTLTAPEAAERSSAEVPEARFTDVTAESGITFVHQNGAYGDKLLPETMGGGVAFFDFDGDIFCQAS